MFKFHRKKLPRIFDKFFTCNSDIHDHNTRHADDLHYADFNTELGKRSVGYWGVLVWNAILSLNLNLNVTITTFKDNLKKAILKEPLSFPVFD